MSYCCPVSTRAPSHSAVASVTGRRNRHTSLDGLRGLAALVVVAHHALLTQPSLAAPYYAPDVPTTGLTRWAVNTPVHLFWAGTEAVYLFFVLSGFVLGLAAQSATFTWRTYLPARLVRLYLPVAGAVALGALLMAVLPRGSQASAWLAARAVDYPALAVVQDLTLLGGVSKVISPLWSLQWEVVFSLFLAGFLSWGRSVHPAGQIGVALVASTWGFYLATPALSYLPLFLVGTALAQWWPDLASRLEEGARAHVRWGVILAFALTLIASYWLLLPSFSSDRLFWMTRPAVEIGVTLVLVAAATWAPLRWLLSAKPFRWAGLISFSLYLVHEPILIAAASLVPGSRWAIVGGVLVAVATAVGFFFLVEKPSHKIARLLGGRRVDGPTESRASVAASHD